MFIFLYHSIVKYKKVLVSILGDSRKKKRYQTANPLGGKKRDGQQAHP